MNPKNSLLYSSDKYVSKFSKQCRKQLEKTEWSEKALDLTHSISDYKVMDERDRKCLDIVLEIFFILETEIIELGHNKLAEHGSIIKCPEYIRYSLVYTLNEMTHARFYSNLYSKFTAGDVQIDDKHIEELYEKYNNIEVFRKRVEDITNVIDKKIIREVRDCTDAKIYHELTFRDFINFSCMEGIKFMSLFFPIFRFARDGKLIVLAEGNRWVSDDEFVHSECHTYMAYYMLQKHYLNITNERFLEIYKETIISYVEDEKEFCLRFFSEYLDITDMLIYIEWLGDLIWKNIHKIMGLEFISLFNNPSLPNFMQTLTLNNKEALHETINTGYIKSGKIHLRIDEL